MLIIVLKARHLLLQSITIRKACSEQLRLVSRHQEGEADERNISSFGRHYTGITLVISPHLRTMKSKFAQPPQLSAGMIGVPLVAMQTS